MQMAPSNVIFLFLILFASTITITFSHPPVSEDPNTDVINQWCDTVPHPEACKFYMSRKCNMSRLKAKSEFRLVTVEVALDRALAAQSHAWRLGQSCRSHRERAAWADCVRLYEHTIIQLKQILQGLTSNSSTFSDFDVQTWLSSALTNLETCKVGSDDMKITGFIWPHISYNVSDLISNGLAISQGILQNDNYTSSTSEYPSWVTHEDRKLLQSSRSLAVIRANFVVAKDGSSPYKTVQSAIDAAARSNINGRKVIYVKRGVYRENIYVNPHTNDIMLVGDGIRYTIITSGRSVGTGYTTYNSGTAGIDGLRFMARDITFQNTAGPQKGQAVALRSASDLSVFYKCAFYGYQDTLFVHSQRQFYKRCYIFGTIDIIFGNAAVVFQNCYIYVRKPITGQMNVITAQGRADPNQNTGIVIQSSQILAAQDLSPLIGSVTTYLGRPWQQYSRTVIMKTYLGPLVNPAGWLAWNGNKNLNTLYYAEYKNFGPGSSLSRRIKWPGYTAINSPNVASKFTVASFIAGRTWLPSTGVPFSSGL